MTPDAPLAGESAVTALRRQFPTLSLPPGARAYITVAEVRRNADGEIEIMLRVARWPGARRPVASGCGCRCSQARVLYGELGKELGRC